MDVTWWRCDPAGARRTVPIGRPIANTQIYLLDRSLQPVPVGVPGELHIGGVGLGRGYLNRPDVTADRFIPDPFGGPGARLYKSGDLARHLPDGAIEFLGRIDHQVKMRGFRIELGEIESRLRDHAAVRDAVVVARPDASGDTQLVAYVVPAHPDGQDIDGRDPIAAVLREHLKHALPHFMIPDAIVTLDSLPLSPNGKIDRRALPDPPAPDSGDAYVAPRTDLEAQIADIWRQVLGVDRVGARDYFFDLGGHSLKTVQIRSRLSEQLGRRPAAAGRVRASDRRTAGAAAVVARRGDAAAAAGDSAVTRRRALSPLACPTPALVSSPARSRRWLLQPAGPRRLARTARARRVRSARSIAWSIDTSPCARSSRSPATSRSSP